jgi:carboxymethylenebutenolidase
LSATRIALNRPEGVLDARLHLPSGDGPWPLVLFYMDAFGLRPAMDQMAGRLTGAGYAVLQPNLYWRSGPFAPFDPPKTFGDPDERARIMALLNSVRVEDVVPDTLALVEEAAKDPRVETQRMGCVGYCMGGRIAFGVASMLGERVAACASIHPGGLVTDDATSPHRQLGGMRARLYLGIADEDRGCTAEHQQALREALDSARVRYALEVYRGALHGFAVPDHSVHDPAAAERHWERVLSLFGDELRR